MRLDRFRRLVRPAAPTTTTASAAQTPAGNVADIDAYAEALHELMMRLDRAPTASFQHSYAGEFDNLQRIDREAVRNTATEFFSSIVLENDYKNRYPNILTNESSRVLLRDVPPGSTDFINANGISGYGDHPGYISTQAPLPQTMADFWQMVLEEKSRVIIMLTREQEERCNFPKCDRYWPDPGQCVLFGQYFVFGVEERSDAAHGTVIRKFRVAKAVAPPGAEASPITPSRPPAGQQAGHYEWPTDAESAFQTPVRRPVTREPLAQEVPYAEAAETLTASDASFLSVTQIQYVDWPDQTVPETANTLLELCATLDRLMAPADDLPSTAPAGRPVIHCSAGVGRTGTFIATHKALRAMQAAFVPGSGMQVAPMPTVHDIVADMKRERSKSVQTAEQYRFIYHALAEGLERYRAQSRTVPERQ